MNLDLLWKIYIIYIYLPHIIGALLLLYAINILVRIALRKFFRVRLPKWWQNDTLIPLVVAASCVIIVIAGGILLAKGQYDWDHEYTQQRREQSKQLTFDVYMPTYIPGIKTIFDQSIATGQKGQKYFFTQYGTASYDPGITITEFSAKLNESSNECTPVEPDTDALNTSKCNLYAETADGKIYMDEDGQAFMAIGDTRIVVTEVNRISQQEDPTISSSVRAELLKLFKSFQKVDPTKLEYVDRSNMHASN